MGIPSYYRKLIGRHANLVRASHPGLIEWFWMDYNCLIYHCLRSPTLRPYPGIVGHDEWEKDFLKEIVDYTNTVVKLVKPTKGVYIAIDGVVPMAKMKQQRLRRFKSAWLVERGLAEGQQSNTLTAATCPHQVARWDTNAITPGTLFMGKLRQTLEAEAKKQKGWIISSSDEPGEGEHKVMEQLRKSSKSSKSSCSSGTETVSHAVYGLDADLIVLSLLTQDTLGSSSPTSLWLFREEVAERQELASPAEPFQWFSIDALRLILSEQVVLRDYCFAMSFLGNDFLPSSLGFKMREDGHDELLNILEFFKQANIRLIEAGTDSILKKGLQQFVERLAATEERRTGSSVGKKLHQGAPYRAMNLPIGDPNWPLAQQSERILTDSKGVLLPNWRSIYPSNSTEAYSAGLHWIWAYYLGHSEKVCFNWYYPCSVPPLWADLLKALSSKSIHEPPPIRIRKEEIQTTEQLALVLPPASWHLNPNPAHRLFIKKAPWFFPSEFHFDSFGKRWFWECEAEIPIPSILEVKAILQ